MFRTETTRYGLRIRYGGVAPRRSGLASTLMLVGAWLSCCASTGAQPDRRSLVERALTEKTRITLENVSLRDAIDSITEQTGVDIHMEPAVMAMVPGGPGTIIQHVEIANIPLREGLDELFAPLGMTFHVAGDGVHIVPKEAIRCLGRAPTWNELDVLAELVRLEPARHSAALETIHNRLQFQVPVREPWSILEPAIRDVGAGPGDTVLDIACRNLGWAWCLAGDYVVITPREQDVMRRLRRPISLRLRHAPLFDAIVAVGDASGVAIRVEPGALGSLDRSMQRNFTFELRHQPAERALEMIAAYTGLGYLVEPDGVLFFNVGHSRLMASNEAEDATRGGNNGDPYVGKVVVPLPDGTSMEWLVRYSELPVELRARRAEDLRKAFAALK